jgi:spore germination cell wall hydrolase CwlJ-like protein
MSGQKILDGLQEAIDHAQQKARAAKKAFADLSPAESMLLKRVYMSNGGSFWFGDAEEAKVAQSLVKRKLITMEQHRTIGHHRWYRLRMREEKAE